MSILLAKKKLYSWSTRIKMIQLIMRHRCRVWYTQKIRHITYSCPSLYHTLYRIPHWPDWFACFMGFIKGPLLYVSHNAKHCLVDSEGIYYRADSRQFPQGAHSPVSWPSHLYNGNSYTVKTMSLFWIDPRSYGTNKTSTLFMYVASTIVLEHTQSICHT